jgi:hypothetical protein
MPAAPTNQLMPAASAARPVPAAPLAAPQPGTGLNSPQIQQAQQLLRQAAQIEMAAAQTPNDLRAKATAAAMAADLKQRATVLMQADSTIIAPDTGVQTSVLTGAEKPTARFNTRTISVDSPSGGKTLYQGPNVIANAPANLREPAIKAMEYDRPQVDAINADAQNAQTSLIRYNEMANIIPQLVTGPTAEIRGSVAARLEEMGVKPETIKRWTGMSSGSMFEELGKLATATIGQSAKNDLGANVGVQSLEIYARANPGALLLQGANKTMTNFGRVLTQLSSDYATGANAHYNPQASALLNPTEGKLPSYQPLSTYKQEWLARNNPQIAAATMGILNGDPFESWSKRVSPEQAREAVAMAARIDPTVKVPTRGGIPQLATDILAHPALPTAAH